MPPNSRQSLQAAAPHGPAFKLLGLDHVVLFARDMDRAVRFWRDVMGAREERRIERIGLVQLRAGQSLIDLVPARAQSAGWNVEHICLSVAPWDPAAIARHLRAAGLEPGKTAERYGADGEGPSIYFTDPDGNQIELKGPPQSAATADIADAVRREIEDLHVFLAAWITGRAKQDPADFEREFTSRMTPDFVIVEPSGQRSGLQSIATVLPGLYGRNPKFEITIHDVTVLSQEGPAIVATYLEEQRSALNTPEPHNWRISTAIFRRAARARNGLEWVHLHETRCPPPNTGD